MTSSSRRVVRAVAEVLGLLAVAAIIGILVNTFRAKPLSWEYRSRERRLDDAVAKLIRQRAEPGLEAPAFLSSEEVENYTEGDDRIVIFDVRPDLFFEDGHIPGAKNFTRDDFEKSYEKYAPMIGKAPCVIVYCAGAFCEESEKMAEALRKLGHRNISVYKGGWEEWMSQNRPVEKSSS